MTYIEGTKMYELKAYIVHNSGKIDRHCWEYKDRNKALDARDWRNDMYANLMADGVISTFKVKLRVKPEREERL